MSLTPRTKAILQALLVTLLWSTSWVMIKLALAEIPALTFAGLRYMLAFLILLPALWRRRETVRRLTRVDWGRYAVLGLVFYTLTQGGQFLTLDHLEATTFSLLLNFSSVLVALFGILALGEYPARLQWLGMGVFLVGVLAYFYPLAAAGGSVLGYVFAWFTVAANALASVLGRSANRGQAVSPLVVTGVSMGIGSVVLLGAGLALEGIPQISPGGWATVAWLALVNTALAFVLWNRSLQHLTAMESSMINNTMLIQIAALAWLFLGEALNVREVCGLLLASAGIFLAQWRRAPQASPARLSKA